MNAPLQKFDIIFMDESDNSFIVAQIQVPQICSIQEIIESVDFYNSNKHKIFIGKPRFSIEGKLENTEIVSQYFQNTIVDLNLWHPNDNLEITICEANLS
jgi:hypothetical protein